MARGGTSCEPTSAGPRSNRLINLFLSIVLKNAAESIGMRILLAAHNAPLQALVKRSLARFHYHWTETDNGFDAFQFVMTQKFDLLIFDFDLPRMKGSEILKRFESIDHFQPPPAVILTATEEERLEIESQHFSRTHVVQRPMVIRNFVNVVQQILGQEARIACLGGGTGLFTLLLGLKSLMGVNLTSIVSMSDDGGSTGLLRDMFGILPPGDVRRSLVALSTAPDLLNELMQYRFQKGQGLQGHSLGNLLLTALSEMRGSMAHAVEALGEILNIQGKVIPVTETVNTLKAELGNGSIIEGEHRIGLFEGHDPRLKITKLWQDPPTKANQEALEALHNARFIILGPGDLYTSIISNLVVSGIREAIVSSRAKKIYICNVMTKPGETTDFKISDHIREIVKYLGKDVLDYVLCSSSQFSYQALKRYAEKNQVPVIELSNKNLREVTRAQVVWGDIVSETELVRHDSLKLAAEIKKIVEKES